MIKKFFNITENRYKLEIYDITAAITILNVVFILLGFWWAPLLGLLNCAVFFAINIKNHVHFNVWFTQVALVILNCYFLTL